MAKVKKLNSMRLLEANGVAYSVHHYDVKIRDAQQVAAAVGMPADEVFKTLVVQTPTGKKPILVMLPSNSTLNLKRMAKALGEKRVAMAPYATAEKLTGLQVGGISPLALMQKHWDVYLDQQAAELEFVVISGGQRGTQLRVETAGLIKLLGCKLVDMADATDA